MTLDALVALAAYAQANYDGALTAVDFGDVEAEFRALTTGVAVLPLPHRRWIRVEGSERVPFLQGQLTSDVAALEPGAGQAAAALTAQGRVEALVALYDAGDVLEIATDAAHLESLRARLERFLVADDVELEAETPATTCFALAGPRAAELLASFDPAASAPRGDWARFEVVVAGAPVRVHARGEYAVPFFEIDAAAERAEAPWRACVAAGGMPAGASALEILRVESGVARYGVDVDDSRIALEARLEWAIHFSKGCYVGQEVIERAVSRGRLNRRLVLLSSDAPLAVGGRLEDGTERDVVTTSVRSPSRGPLAFCYLDVERAVPGNVVSVHGVPARVQPWPRAEVYAGLRG
jgi:folate-binding protein YgfZ